MSEEIKSEVIEKTQKMLGKYVTKPPLTEKLLKKPPFRFLHDIITTVIRSTGFLNGMYTEAELVSDNVKERDAKVAFLTKLIDAVKAITKIELSVKPSKIIAGLEPAETNKLLQAIATALDKKLSSESYVKELKSDAKTAKSTSKVGDKTKAKKTSKVSIRSEEKSKESTRSKPMDETKAKRTKLVEEQKKFKTEQSKKKESVSKHTKQSKSKPENDKKIEEIENVQIKEIIDTEVTPDVEKTDTPSNVSSNKEEIKVESPKREEQDVEKEADEEIVAKFSRSDRPKSARPQTAALKKDNSENVSVNKNEIPARPMSSLRPPSVRPSSARPGAPRLRLDSALPLQENVQMGKINVIVENFSTKETDEEETVVIRTADPNTEIPSVTEILDIPADKGHLVEQILEQIHEDDVAEHSKPKMNTDWEQDGFRSRDATSKELTQLRSSIQALTKVANPLGKLMNYLHEDVEAMHSELNMWMNMKKQIWNEINKQKRLNKEAGKPLRAQLDELEENIKKQEEEIRSVRFNILRNELRIKKLLIK